MDLGERIEFVVREKFAGNASAWAVAAGLSRTMIGTFLTRWRARGEREPSLKRPALEALAGAAGVSFEWLATGRGHVVELDARYPTLERVIARQPGRWLEGAIATARSMQLDADEDPSEARWVEILNAADTGIRVALTGLAKLPERKVVPLEALDD